MDYQLRQLIEGALAAIPLDSIDKREELRWSLEQAYALGHNAR